MDLALTRFVYYGEENREADILLDLMFLRIRRDIPIDGRYKCSFIHVFLYIHVKIYVFSIL